VQNISRGRWINLREKRKLQNELLYHPQILGDQEIWLDFFPLTFPCSQGFHPTIFGLTIAWFGR
jgi:hypothetical protein